MSFRAYRKLLAASVLCLATAGCTDLTVEPKSTVTTANIFSDPASYRAFVAKLYAGLQTTGQVGPYGNRDIQSISDEGFSGYLRLYWNLEELPTDEAIIAWNDGALNELNEMSWGSSNQFLNGMYSRVFFQVSMANEFLRQTTDAKLRERGVTGQLATDIAQYRAEARFIRALAYAHGMDLFGSIPLVDETFPIGSTPPQQATRAQVFDFVVSELNAIRAELPPSGRGQYYGRASTGAADMLLAHVYLNAQVYAGTDHAADARTAAERVIASNVYQLDDDYQEIFLADNHTSPEIIFPVPSDGTRQQSYGGITTIVHALIGGSMNTADFGVNYAWWGVRARPEFGKLFAGAAADRRGDILWTDGQTLDSISDTHSFTQGIGVPKFRNVTSTGAAGSHPEFVDTDFPMFRLADAYLIAAEAILRNGGGTRAQALTYVNTVRRRAYGGAAGDITDAQLTLPFILAERGRELFLEAKRRTDLIRFGQFSTAGIWQWKGGVKAGRTVDAKYDLYPLPANELLANPNLKPTPGY